MLKVKLKRLNDKVEERRECNYCTSGEGMKLSRFLICINLQLLKAEISLRKNIINGIMLQKKHSLITNAMQKYVFSQCHKKELNGII